MGKISPRPFHPEKHLGLISQGHEELLIKGLPDLSVLQGNLFSTEGNGFGELVAGQEGTGLIALRALAQIPHLGAKQRNRPLQ